MIYIVTQRDPFFIDEFLREFDSYNIPYSVYELPNFKSGYVAGVRKAYQLYGLLGVVRLSLKFFFDVKYRKRLRNAKELLQFRNAHELEPKLREMGDGDILLSVSAPTRIPIELVKAGCLMLNIHCGKLPEYAGMMPVFWQIYEGVKTLEISFHHMSSNIDSGRLIFSVPCPVLGSFFATSEAAKRKSAQEFAKLVNGFEGGLVQDSRQMRKIDRLRPFPNADKIKELRSRVRMI